MHAINRIKQKKDKEKEDAAPTIGVVTPHASHSSGSMGSTPEAMPNTPSSDLERGAKIRKSTSIIRRFSSAKPLSLAELKHYGMTESRWARRVKGTDMPVSKAAIAIDMGSAVAVGTTVVVTTLGKFYRLPIPLPSQNPFCLLTHVNIVQCSSFLPTPRTMNEDRRKRRARGYGARGFVKQQRILSFRYGRGLLHTLSLHCAVLHASLSMYLATFLNPLPPACPPPPRISGVCVENVFVRSETKKANLVHHHSLTCRSHWMHHNTHAGKTLQHTRGSTRFPFLYLQF